MTVGSIGSAAAPASLQLLAQVAETAQQNAAADQAADKAPAESSSAAASALRSKPAGLGAMIDLEA